MKAIGPTFGDELRLAGLGDGVSWGADGSIQFRDDVPQATRDAVMAVYAAHDPTKQLPDVKGFATAMRDAMGGIVAANALARAYPLFNPALEQRVFLDVQALIIDAHATGVLNDLQYAALKQLVAKYWIPVVLP